VISLPIEGSRWAAGDWRWHRNGHRRPVGRARGGSAVRGGDIGREGHHAGKNSKQEEGGHHEENTTEEEEEGVPFVNPAIPPSSVVLRVQYIILKPEASRLRESITNPCS
jgi:hypothetical protein